MAGRLGGFCMEYKKTLFYDMAFDNTQYQISLNKKRLLVVIISCFLVISLLCILLSLFGIVKMGTVFMGVSVSIVVAGLFSLLIWLIVCLQIKNITLNESGVIIKNKTFMWSEIQKIDYFKKFVHFYTQPMIDKNLMPIIVEHRDKKAMETLVRKFNDNKIVNSK
jgi:hypothetical protein